MMNEYHATARQMIERSQQCMLARDAHAYMHAAGLFAIAGALADAANGIERLESKVSFVIDQAVAEDAADRGMHQ